MAKDKEAYPSASPYDPRSYVGHRKWWGRKVPPALTFSAITERDPNAPLGLDVGTVDPDKANFIFNEFVRRMEEPGSTLGEKIVKLSLESD